MSIDSIMLCKVLKLKANLPKDFLNKALYHPEFYGLRTFKQVLTENLMANLVKFSNIGGVLGKFFDHRAMDLQLASWMLWHPLLFLVQIPILPMNCFLAGAMRALMLYNLSLSDTFPNVFCAGTSVPILDVLDLDGYLNKRLNPRGPVPVWFVSLANFVEGGVLGGALTLHSTQVNSFCDVGFVAGHLFASESNSVEVYTDSFIKSFGSIDTCGGTAAYFPDADVNISVHVHGLLSSMLVELHAIALALECVPASSATLFDSINYVGWESKCVGSVVGVGAFANINMSKSFGIWHLDGKIRSGFTSSSSAFLCSYLLKALHHHLPVAVRKRLYNPTYLSVLCIRCDMTENSDHVFLCAYDDNAKKDLLLAAYAD
ncbi:hypothetical protein G9A89_019724 [Geosiphon pyriformis]|nr:hypothetical protein G9A89_019724 [Geosiphon pyriformis]